MLVRFLLLLRRYQALGVGFMLYLAACLLDRPLLALLLTHLGGCPNFLNPRIRSGRLLEPASYLLLVGAMVSPVGLRQYRRGLDIGYYSRCLWLDYDVLPRVTARGRLELVQLRFVRGLVDN